MSPGMYAASGNRGAVDTPTANQVPLGRFFTPFKPGDGLRAFADNVSVQPIIVAPGHSLYVPLPLQHFVSL